MGILKFIAVGAFGIVILLILFSGWRTAPATGVESTTTAAPAAVARSASSDFIATGVLTFYSRGGIVSAWIIYHSESGVATKTLVVDAKTGCIAAQGAVPCPSDPDTLAALYRGAHVRVIGKVVAEHVVVEQLSPARSDDPNLKIVTADTARSATALGVTIIPRSFETGEPFVVNAEVVHDGTSESLRFEQGAIVKVGSGAAAFIGVAGTALYFVIATA